MTADAGPVVPRSAQHRRNRRCRLLLAVAAGTVLLTQPAAAQAPGAAFAIEPLGSQAKHTGYFVLDARPGDTLSGRVRIGNSGQKAGDVRLAAVDAVTGPTSGAVYRQRTDRRHDVGAWTQLGPTHIHLAAGGSREVSFTVHAPAGAVPGDHLGGLVAEDTRLEAKRPVQRGAGRFQIRVRSLTIVAIEVRVAGPRRPSLLPTSLAAGGSAGRQSLLLGLRNNGNVLTKGRGQLTVTKDGRTVQRSRFALDTFVPRTTIAFPVAVRGKALGAGDYRGTATLHFAGHQVERSFNFSISSGQLDQVFHSRPDLRPDDGGQSVVPLIAGGAALLAAGFGLSALLFRRRTPTAPRDETVH